MNPMLTWEVACWHSSEVRRVTPCAARFTAAASSPASDAPQAPAYLPPRIRRAPGRRRTA